LLVARERMEWEFIDSWEQISVLQMKSSMMLEAQNIYT
jgi:hypothetical protein